MLEKCKTFLRNFTVLKSSVRELWIIYGLKIIYIIAYGLVNGTLVLWLSSDLGYGDKSAGFMVAAWSTCLTLITVLVGSLVDAVGLRRSLLLGFWICLWSTGAMALCGSRLTALPLGLFPLAVGYALMLPVMVAAIKKYSNSAQRSLAFSLFYAFMNVGFAIAGWLFDYIRLRLGEYGQVALPLGFTLSTYRIMFFWATVVSVPGLALLYFFLREGVEVTEQGVQITPLKTKYEGHGFLSSLLLSCRDTGKDWARIFASLWQQPAFYRFLVFLTLVVGVRLIFYHMNYTFPKYGIRELGEGAPIGRLFGVLNPVLIVFLVPLTGALTQKVSAYKVVIWGSFVSGVSMLFMAMPPAWFAGLANGWFGDLIAHKWLGVDPSVPVNPLYVSITLGVVLLSFGEALWSPRLYEYPAAIAPKGQEASYMSLSLLPYFIAKFFVGTLSGFLLDRYCPAAGPRNSEFMWLLIALMALATPAGLFVLKPYIQVKEQGREEEVSEKD
jgi:MFS family permease